MLTPEIIEIVKTSNYDNYGRHCDYYVIDEFNGLKTYAEKADRDRAYYTQLLCEELGYAPKTGNKFEIEMVNGFGIPYTVYAYTTQHISLLLSDAAEMEDEFESVYYYIGSQINVFVELQKARIEFEDAIYFNIGILDGRFIPIDFGDISFDSMTINNETEYHFVRLIMLGYNYVKNN
jgi:hypothetical protein